MLPVTEQSDCGAIALTTEHKPWAKDLAEAREVAARLRDILPSQVDVAALGVCSKAPYQLLVIREALIWRTEELARNACEAFEQEDFAVVALLARAIAESAALIWYMLKVLEERAEYTPDQLNDKLMRMLVGMKRKKDKAHRAGRAMIFRRRSMSRRS